MTTVGVNSFTQGNFPHLFNRQLAKLNENARQDFAYSLYTQIRGIPRKTFKILLAHLASQAHEHEIEEQVFIWDRKLLHRVKVLIGGGGLANSVG